MNLKKYPKIKRLGHKENSGILQGGTVVVKEKLDGGNGRFTWWDEEDRILFGSRNVEYKKEKDTAKMFSSPINYVKENIDKDLLRELDDEYGNLVIYGEYNVPHTLEYNWEEIPPFTGFDIYTGVEWLPWEETKEIFDSLNLPTVPEIYYGPATDYEVGEDYEFPESSYRDGLPEGIVIRNENSGQIGKYRTPEFKEVHQGQNPNRDDAVPPSDSEMLARKYATEARIQKWIHKYREQGEEIEMTIMENLWRDVAEDIIDEEGEEILLGNYNIDTKEFRSEIASECVRVLEIYLNRPEDSVLNQRQ